MLSWTPRKIHRHFVAVPLMIAALAAVSVADAGLRAGVSALGLAPDQQLEAKGDTTFSLPGGTAGVLADGGVMTIGQSGADAGLLRGEMTASARGFLRLQIGDSRLTALRAGFYVHRDGRSVTIAAVDAPVLVTRGSDFFVVSAGHQLVLSDSQPVRSSVPAIWLRPKAKVLSGLTPQTEPKRVSDDVLSVRMAMISRDEPLTAQELAQVLTAVRTGGDDALPRYLALRLGYDRLLAADTAAEAAAALFPADNAGEWLLALPLGVAGTRKPVPDAFVDSWETHAERMISGDASAGVARLLPAVVGLPATLDQAGYPIHARHWRDALRRLADFTAPLLADGERQSLLASVAPAFAGDAVSGMADSMLEQKAAAHALARTDDGRSSERITALRKVLLASGAMFSSKTSFILPPDDALSIRVSGVYFATTQGDTEFAFTYDTAGGSVSGIERDGKALANRMQLEQFIGSVLKK